MYTDQKLEIQVFLVHKWRQGQGTMPVVKGDGQSLIGRDWLGKVQLDWEEIHRLQTPMGLEETLQKRAAVFGDGLGVLKGVKVSLRCSSTLLQGKVCTLYI